MEFSIGHKRRQQMKKITNETFYKYSFLSDLCSSPNLDKALFLKKNPNKENNNYDCNLYLYKDKKVEKLTSCNSVKQAFWYDNENIVFQSNRNQKKDDEKNTKETEKTIQLYRKNVTTKTEAELFLELKGKISSINALSSEQIVYIKEREIETKDSDYFAGQDDNDNFMRIRRIPFYSNGVKYTYHLKKSLYIYDIAKKTEKEIDFKEYDLIAYNLSTDKTKLIAMASKLEKRKSSYTALFVYDIKSDKLTKVLDNDAYSSKDPYGVYVATFLDDKPFFLGSTMKKHGLNENKLAYIIENKTVKILNGDDINYLNSGVQDMTLGAGKLFKAFDKHIDFITTSGTSNKFTRLNKDGKLEDIFSFDGGITCFDYIGDKKIFIGLNASGGQELYLENEKISNFHEFLKEYYVAKLNPISVKSTDFDIDGFVLLPENYDKQSSVPAVLEIHGGPKAAYQTTYFHEMQMLANSGYVVMYCNPRGSAGKGNEFFDIFGLYGQVDYKNIMDFMETVLSEYKNIDKNRLFVTGGSYGGYMTNHIIGQTTMFKAAVTQRCISNWISMYGTSDIGYYFSPDQHNITIKDDYFWQQLWNVSPLKNIDKIKTPTLIIHSERDYRCPLEQGYQLFTALLDRGIDSEFLVFKDEHHGLSREGKPNNRFERLEAIKKWFDKYDK